MVVDPVFHGPQPQEMFQELNDLLNQVNENEEDGLDAQIDLLEAEVGNNDPPAVEVDIPVLNGPMENFLPLEIQEDDLMNEDEIQEQLGEEAAQANQAGAQNLHVGFVLINNEPFLPMTTKKPSLFDFDNPSRPWAKFFAPKQTKSIPQFLIPKDWANFFTSLLMSPLHFNCARELMQSKALLSCISDEQTVGFSLPKKCLVVSFPTCLVDPVLEDTAVDSSETPPLDEHEVPINAKEAKKLVLVETEVRRSPRIKSIKKGFKDPVCQDRKCLGCNTHPPTLSAKTIRKLASTLCDLEAPLVSDEALNSKKMKNKAPSKETAEKTGNVKKNNKKNQGKNKKKVAPMVSAPSKSDDDKEVEDDDNEA